MMKDIIMVIIMIMMMTTIVEVGYMYIKRRVKKYKDLGIKIYQQQIFFSYNNI